MNIQWYPGHMHKAGKEIKDILPRVDLVIEVLDARIPFSSHNPLLAGLRGAKPCIKVLSKSDLADPVVTQQWQQYLEREQNVKTLAISTQEPERTKQLVGLCQSLAPERGAADKMVQVLIMGIPNVGKSTLINILAGRIIAKTGNEPAITKNQQRIDIGNGVALLDTPGMLWPNVENKNSGFRLAVTGAIKDTAISHDQIAYFAADYLLEAYPNALQTRFQLDSVPKDAEAFMFILGSKRGCLRAAGKIDTDKVAKILLTELRSGVLGRISLETPAHMQSELAELALIHAEKAAKKLARKQKWRATV